MLAAENLSLLFRIGLAQKCVFDNISFRIKPGNIVGVTGDSGSGKTGLLIALGGYLPLWTPVAEIKGNIKLFDEVIVQGNIKNDISLVIENPYIQNTGFKSFTIQELVVPLEMRSISQDIMIASAQAIGNRFGLSKILNYQLSHLSGGELERLHISSALITRPRLLLLDQPFTELDPAFQQRIFTLFRDYAITRQAVVVMTFSPGEVDEKNFDFVLHLSSEDNRRTLKRPKQINSEIGTSASWLNNRDKTLSINSLWFRYSEDQPWLFEGLSFSVYEGEGILILGPNGSGKSTLARLILGLLKPQKGRIQVHGESPASGLLNNKNFSVGCAFQNPDLYFCSKTVKEELDSGWFDKQTPYSATTIPKLLGLSEYLNENPYDLPRGLRKRLSIAVASREKPILLFLDEPTQYQDANGVAGVVSAMRFLLEQKVSLLCCTHDRRLINEFQDFPHVNLGDKESQISKVVIEQKIGRKSKKTSHYSRFGQQDLDLKTARTWFRESWNEAIEQWIENSQERSDFRKSVVTPTVERKLQSLNFGLNSRILDIGCGDGYQTLALRSWLDSKSKFVPILGVDTRQPLLNQAKWISLEKPNIHFRQSDITDRNSLLSVCDEHLGGEASLITCFYVLHDEPDIFGILDAVYSSLKDKGNFLCVFLHPDWIDALLHAGHVYKLWGAERDYKTDHISLKKVPRWRWLGLFPIIQKNLPPFYLPYAHRTLTDYTKLISEKGFKIRSIYNLKTSKKLLQKLVDQKEHPFYKNKNNPYWPQICSLPSSVFLLAEKI